MKTLLQFIPHSRRISVIVLVIVAVALEYYQSRSPRIIPEEQFAFVKWLQEEPEQGSIRLINLPMGRHVSKHYALDQTLGGYPQVEGLAARTPIEAYNYIDSNVILRGWRSDNAVHCFPANPQSYHANLDQVLVDGFSHIILHHTLGDLSVLLSSFVNVPPAYEDEYVMIYRVRDLRQSCDSTAWISRDALMQMRNLAEATVIVPETGSSILSLSDGDAGSGDSSDSNSAVLFGLNSLVLLDPDDLNDTPAEHIDRDTPDPMTTLYSNSVVLLVYDPLDVAPDVLNQYRAALARQFHSCGRPAESSETVIEYFLLQTDFPCELAIEPDPLTIRYDNGIQLGNLDSTGRRIYALHSSHVDDIAARASCIFDSSLRYG